MSETTYQSPYALNFSETIPSKHSYAPIAQGYDQKSQLSIFKIGDVEFTAEDLLANPKGLERTIKELGVTDGGTGKRDVWWR